MKSRSFILAGIALVFLTGQTSGREISAAGETYLIPQTIFVGDRGRLVAALGKDFAEVRPFVSSTPGNLLKEERPDLVITRVELENKNGIPRLLVDFVPYAAGAVSFPAIAMPAERDAAGGLPEERPREPLVITGITVTIASILETEERSLAAPASPLAAPGTGFLLYSAAGLVIALLLFGAGGAVWGKRNLAFLGLRFQRRRLLRAMERLIKKLRADCLKAPNGAHGGAAPGGVAPGGVAPRGAELFSLLSGEFREFLSFFTGVDCRAMTPGEFLELDLSSSETVKGEFLSALFRRWEIIRFGGSEISRESFLSELDELHAFIVLLVETEYSRYLRQSPHITPQPAEEKAEAVS